MRRARAPGPGAEGFTGLELIDVIQDAADGGVEPLKVDRLGQVVTEPGLTAELKVRFAAEATHGDAGNRSVDADSRMSSRPSPSGSSMSEISKSKWTSTSSSTEQEGMRISRAAARQSAVTTS